MEDVGVIGRSGEFLDLLQSFDTLFQRIGSDLFSAKKMDYNTLIPSDWLRGAGYFSSFAHSVTFATHLREDYSIVGLGAVVINDVPSGSMVMGNPGRLLPRTKKAGE